MGGNIAYENTNEQKIIQDAKLHVQYKNAQKGAVTSATFHKEANTSLPHKWHSVYDSRQ